jgi:hypothetical protein
MRATRCFTEPECIELYTQPHRESERAQCDAIRIAGVAEPIDGAGRGPADARAASE